MIFINRDRGPPVSASKRGFGGANRGYDKENGAKTPEEATDGEINGLSEREIKNSS